MDGGVVYADDVGMGMVGMCCAEVSGAELGDNIESSHRSMTELVHAISHKQISILTGK